MHRCTHTFVVVKRCFDLIIDDMPKPQKVNEGHENNWNLKDSDDSV
jgi:hypothetical protein